MIATVATVQIILPAALLLWLALRPMGNSVGLVLQVSGIGALLLALAWVGQWAVLPFWLPYVYGGLWASAAVSHLMRGHAGGLEALPSGIAGWTGLALTLMLLGLGLGLGGAALMGRGLPTVAVVDIANPFGPGRYLVGSGGSREIVNAHMLALNPAIERYRPWRGQSYAVDFFGLNRWGTRAAGLRPADPNAYAIFGAALHAPCAGEVLATENDRPDFEVPELDPVNRLGNHVILRCEEAVIVLAHMQHDSIAVVPGETVTVGDRLGAVGNSGASTEPHLHIHAQSPAAEGDAPISGEPFALRIDGRILVRNDRIDGQDPQR